MTDWLTFNPPLWRRGRYGIIGTVILAVLIGLIVSHLLWSWPA